MKDEALIWKTVASEKVYSAPWLNAYKETCIKPDGNVVSDYYVLHYPNWVTTLAQTKEGKFLLIKQYRHALGVVSLEIPGGVVDDTDDDLQTAAARELLEETGYVFDKYEYLGATSPNPATSNNYMHMFYASGGEKVAEQSLDTNEHIIVLEYTLDELLQALREQKIIQAMHVTTIFYALQKMNKISV